ncbi:response regulator [Steroidobacter sp.]|uniref:response regulator n=1 Tax=Steroidobacter sp. TaxID=1978227 RepID=UPI001A3DC698|nr:response regulator [Steroidobacter sp.]MBL8266273.1 response regulator [Steroidobacter sp.]
MNNVGGSLESSRVLLIDDSLTDAELTIHALKVRGLAPQITWLGNAEEALSYMFRTGEYAELACGPPHLVLLDVEMPGIGGIGVLERLKREPRTKTVPIVMLSSQYDRLTIRKCFELGANSYLVKPTAAIDYFQKISAVAHYWLTLNEPAEDQFIDDDTENSSRWPAAPRLTKVPEGPIELRQPRVL